MSRQIHLQLNRRKFAPILADIQAHSPMPLPNSNRVAALALYFLHKCLVERNTEGLTRLEILVRDYHKKDNYYEQYMNFMAGFEQYLQTPSTHKPSIILVTVQNPSGMPNP